MASTLTMLLTAGSNAALAHIGDSRCYLVRSGRAAQLSVDHTYAEELRATGKFDEAQIARSPFAHALSRAVGMQPAVTPDTLLVEIAAGDQFVLCTDGLTRYFHAPADLAKRLPGAARESLLILLEGQLELCDAGGARRELLDPGDAIGEDRLLLAGPARIAARAVTDLRWLELSGASLWNLARTRPRLGVELSRRLGQRTAVRLRRWKDRVRAESRDIWDSTPLLDLV